MRRPGYGQGGHAAIYPQSCPGWPSAAAITAQPVAPSIDSRMTSVNGLLRRHA